MNWPIQNLKPSHLWNVGGKPKGTVERISSILTSLNIVQVTKIEAFAWILQPTLLCTIIPSFSLFFCIGQSVQCKSKSFQWVHSINSSSSIPVHRLKVVTRILLFNAAIYFSSCDNTLQCDNSNWCYLAEKIQASEKNRWR